MSTYNGWTNYETWNVPLWIDNDYGMYRLRCDATPIEGWDASSVEAFCREMFPEGTPDMDSPADMDEVDWQEIAESWNDE